MVAKLSGFILDSIIMYYKLPVMDSSLLLKRLLELIDIA